MKKLLFLLSLLALQNFSMDWSENISENLTAENLKTAALVTISGIVLWDRYKAWRTPKPIVSGVDTSNFVTKQQVRNLVTKDQLTGLVTSNDLQTQLQALQIDTSSFASQQDLAQSRAQIQPKKFAEGSSAERSDKSVFITNQELHQKIQGLMVLTGEEGAFMQMLTKMEQGWKSHDEKIQNMKTVLAGVGPVINSPRFKKFFETIQSSKTPGVPLDVPIPSEDDGQDENEIEELREQINGLLTFFNSVPAIQKNPQFKKLYAQIISEGYSSGSDLEIEDYYDEDSGSESVDPSDDAQTSPPDSPTELKRTIQESSTET